MNEIIRSIVLFYRNACRSKLGEGSAGLSSLLFIENSQSYSRVLLSVLKNKAEFQIDRAFSPINAVNKMKKLEPFSLSLSLEVRRALLLTRRFESSVDKLKTATKHPDCPPDRPSPTKAISGKHQLSDGYAIALYCIPVSGTWL
jgi:hypothetical protein